MIKYILPLLFSIFVGYICYDYGYKTANNKNLKEYTEQLNQQELKYKQLQSKLINAELEKENEIKAINVKHNAIVSSLRNRPERITFKEINSCTSVCSGAGSTGEQLFREDAEFLIGEATKAMILRESLASCRRYLLEINQ